MTALDDLPQTKRARVDKDDDLSGVDHASEEPDLLEFCNLLWVHFTNYMDSCSNDDAHGDIDELEELTSLIQNHGHYSHSLGKLAQSNNTTTHQPSLSLSSIHSRTDLIPILYSVASHLLAHVAMEEQVQHVLDPQPIMTKEETGTEDHAATIANHVQQALTAFPWNAATWSMAANHARSNYHNHDNGGHAQQKGSVHKRTKLVTQWYHQAIVCAQQVRHESLALLQRLEDKDQDDNDDEEEPSEHEKLLEWIETLLLHHVVGVEWEILDDNPDGEDDEEEEENNNKKTTKEESDKNGYWSPSSVEATARFMAATQLSILGRHEDALIQLQHFDLTHRLAPEIWKSTLTPTSASTKNMPSSNEPVVTLHQRVDSSTEHGGGILPPALYQQLCQLFAPTAKYWTESSYETRGYYSFFMDRKSTSTSTSRKHEHLIYHVIEEYLLPLVLQRHQNEKDKRRNNKNHLDNTDEKEEEDEEIVGYEWWVHHRPMNHNLGHNLHFDTDESLLEQTGTITHPKYSTVLYLTTGQGHGGATVILDQTPQATTVASRAWKCIPNSNNTFLIFPGNLLHGVLPCHSQPSVDDDHPLDKTIGNQANSGGQDWLSATPNVQELFPTLPPLNGNDSTGKTNTDGDMEQSTKGSTPSPPDTHRLTFMVGFWTRRVPDSMKEQTLYGPCGPIPSSPETEWVQEMRRGYPSPVQGTRNSTSSKQEPPPTDKSPIVALPVPSIAPVWEEIPSTTSGDTHEQNREKDNATNENQANREFLGIPHAIDHRFFVKGAPQCFRDSLFEEEDDDDDEEENDEEND